MARSGMPNDIDWQKQDPSILGKVATLVCSFSDLLFDYHYQLIQARSRNEHLQNEVFAVSHRFRSEPVGTGWILIGNFGSQYRPNSRKFLQFFQPDSDRNQWNRSVLPVPSPINSDQYQVELIGTGRKEPHQCIYSRRSPDDILSRGK